MTTPQRALELADNEEACVESLRHCRRDSRDVDEIDSEIIVCLERAAIFRHYAEIMQAEVAGYVVDPKAIIRINWNEPITSRNLPEGTRVVQLADSVPVGSQLIIKPKPLTE